MTPDLLGPDTIDTDRLLLIVTGAHLRAESADRPIAYALRERIVRWLDARAGADGLDAPGEPDDAPRAFDVLVCSDVWWLNNDELRECPTISVGGPGVNALSAYLADKLDSAFVIEDWLMVQLDLDFDEVTACCWGMNHDATIEAVAAFETRYLESFLEAAARRTEPS